MGCDIHIYLEKKNKETGQWEIQSGINKWTQRDRMEMLAGPQPNAEQREIDRHKWLKQRFEKLDSGDTLREELIRQGVGFLYKPGMEKGMIDYDYFRQNTTPAQYENIEFYNLEECFIQEADFLPLGRNYDAFSILADVRNGYGFAGIPTGAGFKPIAEPKGIPDDASDYYRHKAEQRNGDHHSFSYFTVEELKNYDWNQTTIKTGLVAFGVGGFGFGDSYIDLKNKGVEYPDSYFGGGSGTIISKEEADILFDLLDGNYEMENLVRLFEEDLVPFKVRKETFFGQETGTYYTHKEIAEGLNPKEGRGIHFNVRMNWESTYERESGNYYEVMLEDIPKQFSEAADDELRFVFFFDN